MFLLALAAGEGPDSGEQDQRNGVSLGTNCGVCGSRNEIGTLPILVPHGW